jgi:hypothetical protein
MLEVPPILKIIKVAENLNRLPYKIYVQMDAIVQVSLKRRFEIHEQCI